MRISRLQVSNFRSIKKLDIALPQICALVGPNNTGKSNILLAIQRVLRREWVSVNAFDEEDVYGRDPSSDIKIAIAFEPALAYAKFKDADPVEIARFSFEYTRYKVGEQKGERRLEQKCFDSKGKAPMVLVKAPRMGEKHTYQPRKYPRRHKGSPSCYLHWDQPIAEGASARCKIFNASAAFRGCRPRFARSHEHHKSFHSRWQRKRNAKN